MADDHQGKHKAAQNGQVRTHQEPESKAFSTSPRDPLRSQFGRESAEATLLFGFVVENGKLGFLIDAGCFEEVLVLLVRFEKLSDFHGRQPGRLFADYKPSRHPSTSPRNLANLSC